MLCFLLFQKTELAFFLGQKLSHPGIIVFREELVTGMFGADQKASGNVFSSISAW